MSKSDFESVEDLEEVVRALVELADDAAFGRCFESTHGESSLFFADDNRLRKLARQVEPSLTNKPVLEEIASKLSNDDQDRVLEARLWSEEAFLTIGIFLGARIADPSGQALMNVACGWIRATASQPRYERLKGRKKLANVRKLVRDLLEER